jgi:hypothetical protein
MGFTSWRGKILALAARFASRGICDKLLDHLIGPDPTHELVLAEDSPARVDQSQEGVERAFAELDGMTIDEYGHELFNAWKIGQKDINNGVLLVVAPNERFGLVPLLAAGRTSPLEVQLRREV